MVFSLVHGIKEYLKTERNNNMELIDINKNNLYQGYIWKSDCNEPIVLSGKKITNELDECQNPFISEAQLFDKQHMKSYAVRYVDGKHYVKEFDVTESERKAAVAFEPKRNLKSSGKLYFCQRWDSVKDDLCEGMETLIPSALIFTGFDNN